MVEQPRHLPLSAFYTVRWTSGHPTLTVRAWQKRSVKAAADRRRQEQMAKVKVEKKKKAAQGTEVGGFEAHTKGAPIVLVHLIGAASTAAECQSDRSRRAEPHARVACILAWSQSVLTVPVHDKRRRAC